MVSMGLPKLQAEYFIDNPINQIIKRACILEPHTHTHTTLTTSKQKVRLTWLILEVEDGHDVISEIKHRKHSHFGENVGKIAQIKNRQHFHDVCLVTSELFLCPTAQSGSESPPTQSTDSPPSPPVSTVKACDTQAFLLIPLISTASASSSSSSALCASCSAFHATGGFTCQLNLQTKALLFPCVHRQKQSPSRVSMFNKDKDAFTL